MFDTIEVQGLCLPLQCTKWLLQKPFLNNFCFMYRTIIVLKNDFVKIEVP
jgi:hypothetical protein